jgi:hypothetical protein
VAGRRDEELGDVEADAAGADHHHALAHRLAVQQHVDVAEHVGAVLPRDLRVARATPVASSTPSYLPAR